MHETQAPVSIAVELSSRQKRSNEAAMNTVFSIHRHSQPVSRRKTVGDRTRRFECSHCRKSFSRSEHLKRHERAHTKERPFACLHCRRAFVRKDILSRHLKSFHPDLEGPDNVVAEAAAQTTIIHQSPSLTFFNTYSRSTESSPQGPESRSSGSSVSNGPSPLPTGLEPARLADGTSDLTPQNLSIPSSQVQGQAELLSPPSGEHTMSQGSTTATIQHHPPWKSSADTNIRPATSSANAGYFWTEGHQPIENGHFVRVTGAGSPVILDDTFFDELALGDTYNSLFSNSSNFLQSLAFQATNDNTAPLLSGAPSTLLPPAPLRAAQPLYSASAQTFPVPREGSSNQSTSTSTTEHGPSWTNGENRRTDGLEQEMPYAEKLHSLYPSICSDPDALPTTNAFLRYTDFYFKYCNPQLPFLHQPSFDLWANFPALTLSVASIGAIYAAEHETAFSLHCISKRLLKQFEEETAFSKSKTPLGYVQAQFLNMMFAAWSGDARGVKYASSLQSSVVAKATQLLKDAEKEVAWKVNLGCFPHTMHEYEEVKRLFYVVYIVSVIFSSAFGDNPLLFNHDCSSIRLPCQEDDWTQEQPDSHDALFTASITPTTFDQGLSMLSSGQNDDFSPFQLRILIAAIYLEFWQAACLSRISVDNSSSPWKEKIRRMLRAWEACFQSGSERRRPVCINEYERPTFDPSLTFDALALYRHIQVDLILPLRPFSKQLRDHDTEPEATAGALWGLRNQVHRSPEMTEAMNYCLETLRIPLSRGTQFVARTGGPLYWSFEHVPLGSILCILLCLWTSRFNESDAPPVDEVEDTVLRRLIDMLRDVGCRPQKQDLPSVVAGVWETMLNSSCYIWKITPEYAKVFRSCVNGFAENRIVDGG